MTLVFLKIAGVLVSLVFINYIFVIRYLKSIGYKDGFYTPSAFIASVANYGEITKKKNGRRGFFYYGIELSLMGTSTCMFFMLIYNFV